MVNREQILSVELDQEAFCSAECKSDSDDYYHSCKPFQPCTDKHWLHLRVCMQLSQHHLVAASDVVTYRRGSRDRTSIILSKDATNASSHCCR